MRATVLLMLTATAASLYIISLFFFQVYIHFSLDSVPSSGNPVTFDPSAYLGSSSAGQQDIPRLIFGHVSQSRSGSSDAKNTSGLPVLKMCPESRDVTLPTESAGRNRRQSRFPLDDHLHPVFEDCIDLPEAGTTSGSKDEFQLVPEGFVYSAYLDDRIAKKPEIRIIALLKKLQKKNDVRSALYCHVPRAAEVVSPSHSSSSSMFQNHSYLFVSVPARFYEMCENHGKDFGGWILSCELPTTVSPPPCSVYVSDKESLSNPAEPEVVRLTVLRTRPNRKSVDAALPVISDGRIGVCIPPLFGRFTARILTDFIELTRILGADHLFFYIPQQLPAEVSLVLKRFVRLGVVTTIPWSVPIVDTAIWYNGQLLAINDCLYRSMHAFKYVSFNDLDEFVVPHRHSNWTEMLDALRMLRPPEVERSSPVHCGYSFKSAFFDPLTGSSPITTAHRVDYELESNLRTKAFSRVRNKLIVLPALIFELGIHHMSRPLEVGGCSIIKVEPEVAFLHHYRECTTSFDGQMNCVALCHDDSMAPFLFLLKQRNLRRT